MIWQMIGVELWRDIFVEARMRTLDEGPEPSPPSDGGERQGLLGVPRQQRVLHRREAWLRRLLRGDRAAALPHALPLARSCSPRCEGSHGRLLEVGSGIGVDSIQLAKCGFDVTAVDLTESAADGRPATSPAHAASRSTSGSGTPRAWTSPTRASTPRIPSVCCTTHLTSSGGEGGASRAPARRHRVRHALPHAGRW